MSRACIECGGPVTRHSRSGKCRGCSVNVARRNAILELLDKGKSYTEIGLALGITKQAVGATMDRMCRRPTKTAMESVQWQINTLDSISRTRILSDAESCRLERAIKLEEKYLKQAKRPPPPILLAAE